MKPFLRVQVSSWLAAILMQFKKIALIMLPLRSFCDLISHVVRDISSWNGCWNYEMAERGFQSAKKVYWGSCPQIRPLSSYPWTWRQIALSHGSHRYQVMTSSVLLSLLLQKLIGVDNLEEKLSIAGKANASWEACISDEMGHGHVLCGVFG